MSNKTFRELRDFTEYKFKFFTNLDSIDTNAGKEMFKNPAIFWAVCVKECPDGVTVEKIASGGKVDCLLNNDVSECPSYTDSMFMNTTLQYNYCIPRTDKAEAIVKEMYKELDESIGGFGNYINDIKDAWFILLVMSIVAFLVTIGYVWLLKFATKPLLYSSLVLIFFLGCGSGYYAYSQTVAMENKDSKEYAAAVVGSIVIWVIVGLYCFFILCNWNAISLGASIMETASEFIVENKTIIYLPCVAYGICLPIIIWWTASAVFVYGLGTPTFKDNRFVAVLEGTDSSDYMFCYFVFGLFWILSWVMAMQVFITSCTACMWYFTGEGSDTVNFRQSYSSNMAVKWAFTYHAGSMAMGAFLVAVVTVIRLVMEYLMYSFEKANPGENIIWKVIKACIRCVGWSLDCCVKFVNKGAYIQICLHSNSFCDAAKQSFYLAIRNAARASAVSIISGILAVLGKGFIVATCTFMTISIVDASQPQIK